MLIFTSEYNSVLKERENITSSMRVVPSLKKGTKINVFLALAHGLLVLNFSTLVCTALWSETILWGGGVNSEWVHRTKIGIQKYKKLFIMFQKVARAHRKFVLIYFCGLLISSLWFRPSLPLLVLLSSFKAWSEFISIHVFVCLFASFSLFCLRLAVLRKQRPFCWMYHCTSCI